MRQAKIHIRGVNDGAVTETTAEGAVSERSGSTYILYEEKSEGTEESTRSLIKVSRPDDTDEGLEVTIKKQGPITTEMRFSKGQTTMVDYHTPFGRIGFLLATTKLETTFEGEAASRAEALSSLKKIIINIEYSLESTDDLVASPIGGGAMKCEVKVEIIF